MTFEVSTTQAKTGIPYEQVTPADLQKKEGIGSLFYEDSDALYESYFEGAENDTVEHTFIDIDKDGTPDRYNKTILDELGNATTFIDNSYNGTFDSIEYSYLLEDGTKKVEYDFDADGKIDDYDFSNPSKNNV